MSPGPCDRAMVYKRALEKRGVSQGRQYTAELGKVQLHLAASPIGKADKQAVVRLRLDFYDVPIHGWPLRQRIDIRQSSSLLPPAL